MSTPYLAGFERDATEFGAAEGDALAGEVLEEIFACVRSGCGLADDFDDAVEVIEGDLAAEEDVLAPRALRRRNAVRRRTTSVR